MSLDRTNQSEPFVLGMDIGYSGLKLSMGAVSKDGSFDVSAEKSLVLPIGAAPATMMPQTITGEDLEAIKVLVGDETWVAGVEPSKLHNWQRELHEDYPSSKAYLALFYASLALSERKVIDVLVTGLPVDQFHDITRREKLVAALEGIHRISGKKEVTVKKVLVVPQPAGTYLHAIRTMEDEKTLRLFKNGTVLINDPGFYSTDWIIVKNENMQKSTKGTSTNAVSKILETMSFLIRDEYATAPSIDHIESAFQNNEESIFVCGEEVQLKEYLDKASFKVASAAITEIRENLRHGIKPDICILTGGGGKFFEAVMSETFSCKTVTLKNAITANSSGFWFAGQSYCRKMVNSSHYNEVSA